MSLNNEYIHLVNNFCNQTIHNCYYIIRMSKCCGYSAIVIVPKYSNIKDLCDMIDIQFGPNTFNKTYFILNGNYIYLDTISPMVYISQFISQLKMAYTLEECPWSVYQLYYHSECCATDL